MRGFRAYLISSFWFAISAILIISLIDPKWSMTEVLLVVLGGALIAPALLLAIVAAVRRLSSRHHDASR